MSGSKLISLKKYERIVRKHESPVALIDFDNNILVDGNDVFAKLVGKSSAKEVVGATVFERLIPTVQPTGEDSNEYLMDIGAQIKSSTSGVIEFELGLQRLDNGNIELCTIWGSFMGFREYTKGHVLFQAIVKESRPLKSISKPPGRTSDTVRYMPPVPRTASGNEMTEFVLKPSPSQTQVHRRSREGPLEEESVFASLGSSRFDTLTPGLARLELVQKGAFQIDKDSELTEFEQSIERLRCVVHCVENESLMKELDEQVLECVKWHNKKADRLKHSADQLRGRLRDEIKSAKDKQEAMEIQLNKRLSTLEDTKRRANESAMENKRLRNLFKQKRTKADELVGVVTSSLREAAEYFEKVESQCIRMGSDDGM